MNDHDAQITPAERAGYYDPTVEGSLAWHQSNHYRGEWNACWSGKCKRFMRAHGIELAAPHIDAGIRKSDFEKLANERDALLAEVERLKAGQTPDGGEWLYGFLDHNGQFLHHGDEEQARRLVRMLGKPIMRQQVWYGRVEPVESESKPLTDVDPDSATQTTP